MLQGPGFTDIQRFIRRVVNKIGVMYTDADKNDNTVNTIAKYATDLAFIEDFFNDIQLIKSFDSLKPYRGFYENSTKRFQFKEIDVVPLTTDPVLGHDTISISRKTYNFEYPLPEDFFYKIKWNFNSTLNYLEDISGGGFYGLPPPNNPQWLGMNAQQYVMSTGNMQNVRVPPIVNGNNVDSMIPLIGNVYRSLISINPACLRYIPLSISFILNENQRLLSTAFEYYILCWIGENNGTVCRAFVTEDRERFLMQNTSRKNNAYNNFMVSLQKFY